METIVEKRQSLHKRLADQQRLNSRLKAEIGQTQSLAHIGMIFAMTAHEINNILTPLENYAQLALNHPEDKDLTQKALAKTVKNSNRAARILESILSMASGKEQEKKSHKLVNLADEVFTCIGRDFAKDNIKVRLEIPEDLTVWAQGICLQQVLMNLILNAREAMLGRGGDLTISAEEFGDSVKIRVIDTGCGIEQANLKQIFEPFYSTKTSNSTAQRNGSGLGLAFCKRVIDEHDGVISVESQPGCETIFEVILPKHG